ncbi:membrane-anchored junction protein [Colossoma macropomum]|uniref:membrane-anchored junction protein n=1 Tax=Colossoma macropomum TaxID=42526 RepID=UPI0018651410|nr:membrane-anchored junction protein [Colossoma macropomum]
MPVQAFSFPVPETRFFQVGQRIYKFKIRSGSKISCEEEMLDSEFVSEELENAVRAVLMNLDNLQPFSTQHFNIFPYKNRWERVSELRFKKGDMKLLAYPFLITLYVETNEPVPQHTVNHTNVWVPPDRESILDSPPSEPKHRTTEQSQEGALSQANYHNMAEAHHPVYFQESPYLADGAEGMVCGNELHADSEVPSQPVPSAKNPAIEDESLEQEGPEMSDSKPTVREKPGLLSRFVR